MVDTGGKKGKRSERNERMERKEKGTGTGMTSPRKVREKRFAMGEYRVRSCMHGCVGWEIGAWYCIAISLNNIKGEREDGDGDGDLNAVQRLDMKDMRRVQGWPEYGGVSA